MILSHEAGFVPSNQLNAVIQFILILPFPSPMEFTSLSCAMGNRNGTNMSPSYLLNFLQVGSLSV